MSAMEYLCDFFRIPRENLSDEEIILTEANLFACICKILLETYRSLFKDYFLLMKFTLEMETTMLETNLARYLIEDILTSGEYTLQGIALYTDHPEDLIQELVIGQNTNPTAKLLRRIIELHRSVRRDLYQTIISKITSDYNPRDIKPALDSTQLNYQEPLQDAAIC